MIEVHFFIPTSDNLGTTFTPKHDRVFERRLARLFGGYSAPEGLVAGGWIDGRRLYVDESRVYTVALGSITEGAKIGRAVAFAKRHYRQEKIYLRYLGLSEIL